MPIPRPPWLRVRAIRPQVRERMRSHLAGLHTVCEAALCPNIGECFGHGVATFLILGDACTRGCQFCAVDCRPPEPPDAEEPARVAGAAAALGLTHAVVTSVTRDDLPDGGASHLAATIRALRAAVPGAVVEVLVPDFRGSREALDTVLDAGPDILGHNVETVPRLYPAVRRGADYGRSLALLAATAEHQDGRLVKSGLMVGLGERREEVVAVLSDLRTAGCDLVTLGQYLSPSKMHVPVARYVSPEEFDELKALALELGFAYVEAGPLIRSSYRADRAAQALRVGTETRSDVAWTEKR